MAQLTSVNYCKLSPHLADGIMSLNSLSRPLSVAHSPLCNRYRMLTVVYTMYGCLSSNLNSR
ncbi:hypothetical protein BDZ91DRAFT_710632 [Kalaharituber pfeilii]|nr:hypothetical protein BDZ91DRAFT_710632 [Kalaharituber pfeilii]